MLCLSVSLSCAIFCSPSAARPSPRQAPSSNSAPLADVLYLTLAHHRALCHHTAGLTVPPVAHKRIITDTRSNAHISIINSALGSGSTEGINWVCPITQRGPLGKIIGFAALWLVTHVGRCVCLCVLISACVSVMSRVQRLKAILQWWSVAAQGCVWVCGLFDHMYSLLSVLALCRLLNLLYSGYTCIISSSPSTSLCHSAEQGHLTPMCVSTYLNYKNKITTFFLLWLKTLGSCLQHCTLVISVFSPIISCILV